MNHKTLSLEVQFEIELLKRYLKNHSHPEQEAHRLAVAHFEDYLELVCKYQKLEAEHKKLEAKLESQSLC